MLSVAASVFIVPEPWAALTSHHARALQALTLSGDHFLPTGTPAGASGGAAWTRRVMRRARDVQPDMLVWALDGEPPIFLMPAYASSSSLRPPKPAAAAAACNSASQSCRR